MAKQSVDALENTIAGVTKQFTEAISCITEQFNATINELINKKFSELDQRLKSIEEIISGGAICGPTNNTALNHPAIVDLVSKTVLEVDKQKEDLKVRSCNIVISGLDGINSESDKTLLEKFCEENLTVKPHIATTRRLRKGVAAPSSKLLATLDSPQSVQAVLESATLLRKSTNPLVKKVFFNRDMTREQLEAAYKARCQRRNGCAGTSTSDPTIILEPAIELTNPNCTAITRPLLQPMSNAPSHGISPSASKITAGTVGPQPLSAQPFQRNQ